MPIGDYGLKIKTAVNDPSANLALIADISEKPLLHEGIAEYEANHEKLVKDYLRDYSLRVPEVIPADYFRNAFYEALTSPDAKFDEIPEELIRFRETEPEKASIPLEKFLGERLAKLYMLALEEEMNSKNYRDA